MIALEQPGLGPVQDCGHARGGAACCWLTAQRAAVRAPAPSRSLAVEMQLCSAGLPWVRLPGCWGLPEVQMQCLATAIRRAARLLWALHLSFQEGFDTVLPLCLTCPPPAYDAYRR